ncbi:MAG TPA: serine hydrolase domain-containing protein [Holophaga sp.]|nr:serine hydrolase domain-containing protein [Holophaga sp.]
MKKPICLLVLVFASSLLSFAQTSPIADDRAAIEKVDRLFAPWNRPDTPGAAVAVIRDGRILMEKCYGSADLGKGTLIGPDTAFRLGSVTKQFTAMAVMQLAERGKLSYEDPLSKYFPVFPAYARKITLRHLLQHTAGLPEYEALFVAQDKIDWNWPRSVKSEPSAFEPTSKDALEILAQVEEPRFAAGSRYEYSNSGYVILAQIVERVSGQPFARFLRENIFQPLGMDRTCLSDQTRPGIQKLATSYRTEGGAYKDIDYTPVNAVYGADGIYSTLEDMCRWDQALYTEKLVKRATLEEAFTPGRLNDGSATCSGFGWRVDQALGFGRVSHGGAWLGFRNAIVRFPDQRFTVILLANHGGFNVIDFVTQASRFFLQANP